MAGNVQVLDSDEDNDEDPNVALEKQLKKEGAIKREGAAVKSENVKREKGDDVMDLTSAVKSETGAMALALLGTVKPERADLGDDVQIIRVRSRSAKRRKNKKSPSRSRSKSGQLRRRSRSASSGSNSTHGSSVSRSRSGSRKRTRFKCFAADVKPRSRSRKGKKKNSKFSSVSQDILNPRKRAVRRAHRSHGAAAAVQLLHGDEEGSSKDQVSSLVLMGGSVPGICQV